ncbi:UPF0743 protein [Zancudomyces culisetae]|uniref:UPF0743 protein n=1 Tax=Zancudomyces culisetae TaxID=1213189 RepID=A0A1R1PYF6_ZANCU|nr:UPF0743 protein [Zancudomyces culisetae]|eukprot:OMH85957.1 UPF0743 protein [Zancudomyces culisetae]
MVSFVCNACQETLKKPKLDQHRQRCQAKYGHFAGFTCIDCNTDFVDNGYRAHTTCISEEQKYMKSLYTKGNNKKQNNKNQAQNQNNQNQKQNQNQNQNQKQNQNQNENTKKNNTAANTKNPFTSTGNIVSDLGTKLTQINTEKTIEHAKLNLDESGERITNANVGTTQTENKGQNEILSFFKSCLLSSEQSSKSKSKSKSKDKNTNEPVSLRTVKFSKVQKKLERKFGKKKSKSFLKNLSISLTPTTDNNGTSGNSFTLSFL